MDAEPKPWDQQPGFYAGIGSRKTPKDVLSLMRSIATELGHRGWTLRSGCAEGADQAFQAGLYDTEGYGADNWPAELFLPWSTFAHHPRGAGIVVYPKPAPWTYPIAAKHHPHWYSMKATSKPLHARNVHQILGPNEPPVPASQVSRFVLCWTPDGAVDRTSDGTGGTGQAIRVAVANEVLVYNLRLDSHRKMWEELLSG